LGKNGFGKGQKETHDFILKCKYIRII